MDGQYVNNSKNRISAILQSSYHKAYSRDGMFEFGLQESSISGQFSKKNSRALHRGMLLEASRKANNMICKITFLKIVKKTETKNK